MNDVSSEMSVSLGTLRPLTPDIAEFVAEVPLWGQLLPKRASLPCPLCPH
jgi:hypothetical protein